MMIRQKGNEWVILFPSRLMLMMIVMTLGVMKSWMKMMSSWLERDVFDLCWCFSCCVEDCVWCATHSEIRDKVCWSFSLSFSLWKNFLLLVFFWGFRNVLNKWRDEMMLLLIISSIRQQHLTHRRKKGEERKRIDRIPLMMIIIIISGAKRRQEEEEATTTKTCVRKKDDERKVVLPHNTSSGVAFCSCDDEKEDCDDDWGGGRKELLFQSKIKFKFELMG